MDSAQKEAVESTIEIACSKVFEILDEKLETISNIGDENAIKTAVFQGIVSARWFSVTRFDYNGA